MPRCMLGVWCLFELCICCPYLALHTPCDSSIGIANCEPPDHQLNPVILHALPKRLFLWWLRFAKASCVSQILTAQAVASDMGGELAATTGVRSWAACNVKNSERDAHRTIEKQKSKLELKISTIRCSSLQMPWISPEAWFSFLVRKGLWPVLAGCDRFDYSGASRNWTEFWGTYQELFPGFEVFNVQGLDLSRTAAVFYMETKVGHWNVVVWWSRPSKVHWGVVTTKNESKGKLVTNSGWILLDIRLQRDSLSVPCQRVAMNRTPKFFNAPWIILQNPFANCWRLVC